uniref:Protein aurora borealis n=1 Tax=Panagrolaimus sp. ES5 TaxID=591445 RepID=A0AC34GX27_9BILA
MASDDSAYGRSNSSNDESQNNDANSTSNSGNLNDLRSSRNITNPFDSHLIDSFHHTTFSPNSVLKTPATSKTKINSSFQWSIEQRSRILPAMIDESFIHESPDNPEYELQIQKTLDKYWSSQLIAPSPDVIGGRIQKPLNFTPSPIVPFSRRNSRLFDSSSSPISRSSATSLTKDTQTDISIPIDFDLEALLSKHLPQKQTASTPKMKKFSSFIDKSSSNRDSLPSDADLDVIDDENINLSVAIDQSTKSRGDDGFNLITEHINVQCEFDLSKISPIKLSPHTRLSPIKEDN